MLANARIAFRNLRRRIVATGVETVDPLSLGEVIALDTGTQKPKFHAANRAPVACADQRVYFHKVHTQEIYHEAPGPCRRCCARRRL